MREAWRGGEEAIKREDCLALGEGIFDACSSSNCPSQPMEEVVDSFLPINCLTLYTFTA